MYAIAFDLDTELLQRHYPNTSWRNGYEDVGRVLAEHGFGRQQGSVYFAQKDTITPVHCVLAVQDIVRRHPWFRAVVSDIRMLRIEENNDLAPALGEAELPLGRGEATPAPK